MPYRQLNSETFCTMTPKKDDFHENIPEDLAATLDDCSSTQLLEIIHYAQDLLYEERAVPEKGPIEPREGEEIVQKEDQGAYTRVVVERPDETGEARGPFAYRVNWVPSIDGQGGHYSWHYQGKVKDRNGGV